MNVYANWQMPVMVGYIPKGIIQYMNKIGDMIWTIELDNIDKKFII